MKYTIKDYEDIRKFVDAMTEEELLISVTCPNVSPERPGMYHGIPAVFFHTQELKEAGMKAIEGDEHQPLVVEDMESMFVPMRACANSGDETLAYAMAKCKAHNGVARGFHWGLGPCVDLTGNPNCPVVNKLRNTVYKGYAGKRHHSHSKAFPRRRLLRVRPAPYRSC